MIRWVGPRSQFTVPDNVPVLTAKEVTPGLIDAHTVVGLSGPRDPEDPIVKDAAAVSCPVLFLLQWHDELVAREKGLALFDAIGSEDKRLHAQPGPHRGVPPEEFDASEAFLGARLGPSR